MTLTYHKLASVFPLIEGAEFDALVEDVRTYGVREPIWLYEGQIIDGRNRYRASEIAGADCPVREYVGDDPIGFVVSLNLKRRHLDASQRAMVAARMATLRWGQRADRVEGSIDLSTAAMATNVSEPSVKRTRIVLDDGCQELKDAVDHGRVAVHEAARVAKESEPAQRDFLASGKNFMVWSTDRRRRDMAAELAETTCAQPVGKKRWPIILADPPWQYDDVGIGSANRRIENHYPTMPLADILDLPVGDLATDDSILFLWTTAPMLMAAGSVIAAWGFTYRTGIVCR